MLQGWERQFDPAGRELLADVLEEIADDAYRYATVDTGRMRETIHWRLTGPKVGRVIVGTDYWFFVEYGSKPHVIRASGSGALHFYRSDGQEYYRAAVQHPGTPEQPFMRPALYQYRTR
jgi:hypothetical protein